MLKGFLIAVSMLFVAPAVAGPINLVTNGSFEFGSNDAVPGDWTMQEVGATDLTGWSITQNNIDWGNGFWQAADGTHSLDLNGNHGAGGISQLISTQIGQTYTLDFSLSGNPNLSEEYGIPGDLLVSLIVSAGSTSAAFDFNVLTTQTDADMAWTKKSLTFTADGNTMLVQFVSTTYLPVFNITLPDRGFLTDFPNCCFGPAIDDVSVTAVPEPPTLALFGPALLALAWLNTSLLRGDRRPVQRRSVADFVA